MVKWNLVLILSMILCFNITYVHFRTAENWAGQKWCDILLSYKSVVFVRLSSLKNHRYLKYKKYSVLSNNMIFKLVFQGKYASSSKAESSSESGKCSYLALYPGRN